MFSVSAKLGGIWWESEWEVNLDECAVSSFGEIVVDLDAVLRRGGCVLDSF